MITIYFKEAKEKYDSVFDLLSHYFYLKNIEGYYRNPATYWADTHEKQCDRNRNRSFDDLLLLSQHYFPEAIIEDVVNALYKFNENNEDENIICIYCSTIKRFVIPLSRYPKSTIISANYVNGLFPPNKFSKDEGNGKNSQWTLDELKAMIKDD